MANVNNYETVGESKISELLVRSDLTYLDEDQANLIIERSQKKQFSQQQSYSQEKIVIINLNTGNDFVSFTDSSLKFKLDLSKAEGAIAPVAATFGAGSILNLIENIKIVSRSGVVLTEISALNLWNYYNLKMSHTYEWRSQQAGKLLLGSGGEGGSSAIVSGKEWVIPLNVLCPFFDMTTLAPAALSRGLRIELTLASVSSAFKDTAGVDAVASYTVSDIELILDTYRLSSGAVDSLNQVAATSGMVMTFHDVDNSPFDKNAGPTSFSGEVRQTVSMANLACACVRLTTDTTSLAADSLKSIGVADDQTYQFRIGSVYLPQERVEGEKQYYNEMTYATSKQKYGRELGIRASEFGANNLAIADMNRYWTSNTGVAINSSTTLNLQMGGLPATQHSVDLFLKHTRSINIFLENIVVRE